ncbi:MAG TPA: DUF4167 domain-containing protein [Rhizomicrobium sp.]|nr:DUF4167 domain-containing protein [Rhizomicrobium sp.]
MKRSRSRGRRPQTSNHNPNRTFDSSGPEIKIRGSASHVYEKYLQMARDANAAGDRVAAENYLQHAEHYWRIMAASQPQQQPYQQAQPYPANGSAVSGNGRDPSHSGSAASFSLADAGQDAEEEEIDDAAA